MNWRLWLKQVDAIAWIEFKRFWLSRRAIGIYLIALAPNFLLLPLLWRPNRAGMLATAYAVFFEMFWLRLVIFFGCASIFSQFFRGEILQKTLHYYLLAPVRREIVVLGKYLAAFSGTATLFSLTTISSYLLYWGRTTQGRDFLASTAGAPELARYVTVVIMACAVYGALFLVLGLLFKNPMLPSMFVLTWESLNNVLPAKLQRVSIVHYLRPLLPVELPRGPFVIMTEPPSPFVGIPGLLLVTAALLVVAGAVLRRTQITYSAD